MAAKSKRPTGSDIKGMLLEGNFGSSGDEPLPLSDPISTTQLVLKLSEVKPYDKNPRRERNPKYDEIKASIRNKKTLNNNLNVTRRPDDDRYMIESGGNTRLAILNELYIETADEVFNKIHCLFVPWQSESNILTAHLIENEMRGDMMLIDKSYAVQELRRELESEKGETVSDREFTRLASESGYKISPKLFRRFNYAIKLDQMIPTVLRSGIGGTKLDFMKKVEKAYREVCEGHQDQFDAAFMGVMSENDTEERFDFDQVRNELDRVLEKIIGIRSNIIYMKVTQIVDDNPGNRDDYFEFEKTPQGISPKPQKQAPVTESAETSSEHITQSNTDTAEGNIASHSQDANETITEKEESISSISNEIQSKNNPTATPQKDPAKELKWLRERGYDLALKIARPRELEESVMPADNGLGFFIETPIHQLTLNGNEDKYYCWWMLYNLSEQIAVQEHTFCWMYLDLYRRLGDQQNGKEKENELLSIHLGEQPPAYELFRALHNVQNINDKSFSNIFRLMENCRQLRTNFSETELWEQQS
jgi:ParB family protein of integrating conjugative element (PFGI_1 class)